MQSFDTLNAYGSLPVDYGTFRTYEIVFGANAGNTSRTEYQGGAFLIPKQVPLVTFNNPSKDLLLNLDISPANAVISVTYVGNNSQVVVYPGLSGQYAVTGIRSVTDYNEVFGNLYIDTPETSLAPFSIVSTVDDQFGNTRTWTTNVSLIVNPGFQITGNLTYNEDQIANINNIAVLDPGAGSGEIYNIVLSTANANVGLIQYQSGTPSTSVSTQLVKTSINTSFSTNQWKFIPAADYTANSQVQYFQQRTSDGRTWIGNVNLNIGTTHNEYTVPANITYDENKLANITGLSITDTRPNNINPNIQYTSTLSTNNVQVGYLRYLGTDYTTLSLSNTKANINSALANVRWVPGANYTGNSNVTLTYSQTQTTDNKQQAVNVAIPVRLGNLAPADYSVPTSISYNEDTLTNITGISITDIRPDNIDPNIQYQINITSSNVANGTIQYANVQYSDLLLTNTKANINSIISSGAIKWLPAPDYFGNTTITYTQRQFTDNILQANAVPITMVRGTGHSEYSIPSSLNFTENNPLVLSGISITDTRPNLYPNLQYQVSMQVNPIVANLSYNGSTVSNLVLTGTKAQVNAALSSGNILFVPALDYDGITSILYSQTQTTDGIIQASQVPIVMNGIDVNPYSVPASIPYIPNTLANINSITITDNAPNIISTTYSVNVASANTSQVQISYNSIASNSVTFTGSKAVVNAALANVKLLPANSFTSNSAITYRQVRNYDGLVQANNISIPVTGTIANLTTISRSYIGNATNNIFATSPIQLIDQGLGNTNYTITLTSNRGKFGTTAANAINQSTFVYNSDVNAVNSVLSNMKFVPDRGATTTGTYTFTLVRDGQSIISYTAPMTYTSSVPITSRLETYTSNANVSLTFDELYFGTVRVLLVGGGSAGANGSGNQPGRGGSGGQVKELTSNSYGSTTLLPGTLNFIIGAGGNAQSGSAASNTYISLNSSILVNARAGETVSYSPTDQTYSPGNGLILSAANQLAGGGPGSGGAGGNAALSSGTTYYAGHGGIGVISNISGSNVYYGGGGGGAAWNGETSTATLLPGNGGNGGGGRGARYYNSITQAPVAGTNGGGGGGGVATPNQYAARGGNGLVILKVS